MQSDAKEVTHYLETVPENRRACLEEIRRLCLECLPNHVENMTYGMPGYSLNGTVDVGFASQKNYISFYILKQDVMQANLHLLKGLSVGKGCIRYSRPEKIDFEVVRKLLEGTHLSNLDACAPIPASEIA